MNAQGLSAPIRTIFCIGRNYAEHARELGNAVPTEPVVFIKPVSAVCFSGGEIRLPRASARVDHEVEVVVGLRQGGTSGRDIPEADALAWVEGYAVGLDMTARDLQESAKKKGLPWSVAKGFDTFAALSPFAPASLFPDPADVAFDLSVNSVRKQSGNTSQMLFPIGRLISYLSTVFTLAPGDIIYTGTPQGVGAIEAGDRLLARLGNGAAVLEITVARG